MAKSKPSLIERYYPAGTWFLVPLWEQSGRVLGRSARAVSTGRKSFAMFAYYFAPPFADGEVPTTELLRSIRPSDAYFHDITVFTSTDEKWDTVDGTEDFDPTEWPLVEFEGTFVPKSHPPDTPVLIRRFDDDLETAEAEYAPDEPRGRRPTDSISMPGATQVGLTRALAGLPPAAKFPAKAAGYDPPPVPTGLQAAPDPRHGLQSLELFLQPGLDPERLFALVDALEPLVSAAGGIVDGEGMSYEGRSQIGLYAPSAERLYQELASTLEAAGLPAGSEAVMYDAHGDEIRTVAIQTEPL